MLLALKINYLDCGLKGKATDSKIVGGTIVTKGEYPWQALVLPGRTLCGGTVMSSMWILTAAHCLDNAEL